jgi:Tfp pilus assembly protein PilF
MPLESHDQKRLTAAVGYLELGMHLEANDELEKIDPYLRSVPEVLIVRVEVYQQAKAWDLMEAVTHHLVKILPEEVGNWTNWAYATRRSDTLQSAKDILIQALKRFPTEALVLYNLACYECQLGNIEDANEYLKQAFKVDPSYRLMGLDDPDLEPLWSEIGKSR